MRGVSACAAAASSSSSIQPHRPRSPLLLQVHLGFNSWEVGCQEAGMAPTCLWRSEGVDWWATPVFEVPPEAYDLSLAFTDGHGAWDNNDGHNFSVPVTQPLKAAEAPPPRTIASTEVCVVWCVVCVREGWSVVGQGCCD